MTKRLMNQGKRTFNGAFKPGMVGIFDDKQGEKLLSMYPKEIIDLDNLTVQFDSSKVQDFSGTAVKKATVLKPSKKAAGKGNPSDDELSDALKS